MFKKIFLILLFWLFFIEKPLLAEEKVEVITPEKIEETSEILYPAPYVPVLKGLNYRGDKSAILKTGNMLTGILVFKGNYKANSLIEFYRVQMKANGWEEIGSFTSKMTFLAFKRPEGQVFIGISEDWYQSEVSIVIFLTGVK